MARTFTALLFWGILGFGRLAVAQPTSEVTRVQTARGATLEVTLDRPISIPRAAVVLAPGQGYHRGLPLLARAAEELARAGFLAIRFDWAYFTLKSQPSANFVHEREDLDAVVAFAKRQPGVERILLAGKSLGSVVALEWLNRHPGAVHGLALLTPPFTDPETPKRPRAGTEQLLRHCSVQALWLFGDRDPLAQLSTMLRLAVGAKQPPLLVVVPGDHSLRGPSSQDEPRNVALAVAHLVRWAERLISESSS